MKSTLTLISTLFMGVLAAQEPAMNNDSLTKEVTALKKEVAGIKKLKISGWIQAQFQYAESRGVANFDGGNFAPNSDKRFMIRRGRVKFTYNGNNSQYVMQINGTERGLNLVEIFGTFTDPWTKSFSISAGVMNRPFGFEIDQSSAVRESPERSRYSQILMPNERDMGAKIIFAPAKGKALHGLRLDAGFYNGQGIYVPGTTTPAGYPPGTTPVLGVNEFDFQKDFIGRLCYYKTVSDDKITFGFGTSHYNGGNMYQSNQVYETIGLTGAGNKDWLPKDTLTKTYKNKTAPRVYYGGEGFFSFKTGAGTTTLRGEYITGTQSGQVNSTSSPFFLPSATATYIRKFEGAYLYFIHRIAKHELALKYEWYDPNMKVTGKDVGTGTNSFTVADLKYTQTGITYNYYYDDHVKFMFNYNIITNETVSGTATGALNPLTNDLKDNILTVRMTYRF